MPEIVIRQTAAFAKRLIDLHCGPQFLKLTSRLQQHPALGDVIPGASGLRKVRMALPGRGNQGGARVIYVWLRDANELFFVWIFTKGEATDLNAREKTLLIELANKIKSKHQNANTKNGGGQA